MLASSYSGILVVFSLIVAVLASYTALNMAGRVASTRGRASALWLVGGSVAMGFGIWSMHFVGMLAFRLPIQVGYDLGLTVLSLVIAIVSSAFALWLVCLKELPRRRLAGGALLLGAGIAAMHYTGMAAMKMEPGVIYDPWLFAASIVIAVIASGAALWIAFRLRRDGERVAFARLGASLVMGCAIVGMHYTGMAASQFPLGSWCGAANTGIDPKWLAVVVILVSLAVFAIALVVSLLDVRADALATSLDRANSELVQLALHDNLTRLPNRVLLGDRMDQAIQKASRERTPLAVLFIDLDGFKAVNDVYGHHIGDLLLKQVSARILATQTDEGTVARLGGDEFVMVLDVARPEDAALHAQRLVDSLMASYDIDGNTVHVSASVGIAIYPENGRTTHELMVNADAAMYHAKEQGRNGYCFFESAMNANVHQQLQLQQDLRRAVDRGEFLLHYQPKLVSPKGPMVGVEALLRWQKPGVGLMPPDAFLSVAERTGLIVPIGNWVIDEACRQMREWQAEGHADWTVSVNLSTVQLTHAGLVDVLKETLARHALDPRHLVLEVTESTAMRDAEASLAILNQVAALGVGISIDDFGTGYSSLLYLKQLPADELKIDRGFITELTHGNDDEAIVAAIIGLGKTLGLKIVAEGVETIEQQELLTRLGCNALQGYLLGSPVPAHQLVRSAAALA
ncbi:bifunctional diguanylate cyclase/phosphodiesterase [Luteibacter sp. 329MFSha]|uniref:putative bifunctional diguanylate cyclase/phosphodiesterase n=1 Tax=Luteibacter sp. 329MFSha TaxID=1798239 RepID=UPI0008B75B76|nr:bifunctional diguanylate cyclase/phosphodiesterase [Luteibacter sp. 329MFSha]SEW24444.1 diguanylate cyclase (GGDEF) domain-containing protein [Luteibacter sp. 329MFSha]